MFKAIILVDTLLGKQRLAKRAKQLIVNLTLGMSLENSDGPKLGKLVWTKTNGEGHQLNKLYHNHMFEH